MKRIRRQTLLIFSVVTSFFTAGRTTAQTSLRLAADNIDQIIANLTLDEKAKLLVGVGLQTLKQVKWL